MVKLPDGTEWIRPAAAAELLPGISPGRIRVWVHRGKVRSIRVGRATFVAWPDLLDVDRAARISRPRQPKKDEEHAASGD